MKTAFVFSGQGAQYAGMGKELYDNYHCCKEVFDNASDILGYRMDKVCFDKDSGLNDTALAQPAIFTVSMAALALASEFGIKPDCAAGLSLGEYTALCASGAFLFEDALKLVAKRGQLMKEALPPDTSGMSAILSLSRCDVEEICKEASAAGIVSIANVNCSGQTVIGGETAALVMAEELAVKKGAKRVIRLNVAGAFHTVLLDITASALGEYLENIVVKEMKIPVYCNLTGRPYDNAETIKGTLVKHMKSTVEWEAVMLNMIADGISRVVELGPGKALSGFFAKTSREIKLLNIEDTKSYQKLFNQGD